MSFRHRFNGFRRLVEKVGFEGAGQLSLQEYNALLGSQVRLLPSMPAREEKDNKEKPAMLVFEQVDVAMESISRQIAEQLGEPALSSPRLSTTSSIEEEREDQAEDSIVDYLRAGGLASPSLLNEEKLELRKENVPAARLTHCDEHGLVEPCEICKAIRT